MHYLIDLPQIIAFVPNAGRVIPIVLCRSTCGSKKIHFLHRKPGTKSGFRMIPKIRSPRRIAVG
jgi:hypothetical protein